MKKWLVGSVAFCLVAFSVLVGIGADVITKGLIGKEDIYWQVTDGGPAETFARGTSTGGTITLTRINASQIPWDNSYTRTIRPGTITGNNSGSVTGYSTIRATSVLQSLGTLLVTGAATLSSSLTVNGATTLRALTADNVTTGTVTATAGTFSVHASAPRYLVDTIYIDTGTAAPTSGTWITGSIVFNTTPASPGTISAAPLYWYCTSGGAPGTWIAVYPLFRVAPASAAALGKPGMMAYDNTYFYANAPAQDNAWKRVELAGW
jgi:hypothetical protein